MPLLEEPDPAQARRFAEYCASDAPVDHAGYLELLSEIPFVLSCLHALPGPSRDILREHVRRSAEGMIEVVARSGADRVLRLGSIPELRDYCYVVAGIVGEMLTELFLLNHPRVAPAHDFLRARSRLFGEALQLVNILKDAEIDEREGRIYIPPAQQRGGDGAGARGSAGRQRIHAGAAAAWRRGRPGRPSTRCWCGWRSEPWRPSRNGVPGNKLSRMEVLAIISEVVQQVDQGQPPLPSDGLDANLPAAE